MLNSEMKRGVSVTAARCDHVVCNPGTRPSDLFFRRKVQPLVINEFNVGLWSSRRAVSCRALSHYPMNKVAAV